MPEKCMGCLYGERKTKESDFIPETIRIFPGEPDGSRQWATEPRVGRVANGVSHRVDRIKCLGNAVVPQQFYPIFKAIAEIETRIQN